jgi:ERCC4-type nuclease
MILVDSRVGSVDLADPLRDMGLPVEVTQLTFGDVCFEGRGNNDKPVLVGVELKKLSDLVSSLRTGRLSGHQVPGMIGPDGAYDFAWIVVEGTWRVGASGVIETPHRFGGWKSLPGKMTGSEMEKRLLTLEMLCGLHIRFTTNRAATLHCLATLFRWWNDQSMDRHSTHLVEHTSHGFLPLSEFRQVVKRLPGVGLQASLAAETWFGGNLITAFNAPAEEWAEIFTVDKKGNPRRLGTKTGERIVAFLKGEK